MRRIGHVVCLVNIMISLVLVPGVQASQPLDNNARQAMLALNYCHTSLVKILAYEDRIVLDEEYNNIINNINLTAIQDEEILRLLQSLMDTLTAYKLAEADKELLVRAYNKRVAEMSYAMLNLGFKDVVKNEQIKEAALTMMTTLPEKLFKNVLNNALEGFMSGGIFGGGAGLVRGVLLSTTSDPGVAFLTMDRLASIGTSYQHYRNNLEDYREALDQNIWQLERTTIQEINETRKAFLEVYWTLMQKYSIPDHWRLTEKQLQRAIEVFKEHDLEKKLRQLEGMQEDFAVFPPFWYEFAQTAQKVGRIEDALKTYDKIEREYIQFFREDHEYSSVLMNKVVLIQAISNTQPELLEQLEIQVDIPKTLRLITQNSPDDWRKNLFAALQYLELKDYDAARTLIMRNIDMEQEISLNTRILGEIYAISEDEQRLAQLIDQMRQHDAMRYQDTLYLIGMIRDGKLLRDTMNTVVSPTLADIRFAVESHYLGFGADTLTVSLPAIWLKHAPDQFELSLYAPAEEHVFVPVRQKDSDNAYQGAHFCFENVFNADELLEKRETKTLVATISDLAQPVALLIEVSVHDIPVEDNLLDKTGKTVGKATKYMTRLFSEETDPSATTAPKTKPMLTFTIKELATASGACYTVSDESFERLQECHVQVEL